MRSFVGWAAPLLFEFCNENCFWLITSVPVDDTIYLYLAVKSMHIKNIEMWYQSLVKWSLVIDISLYFHCSVFLDYAWLFHSLNAAHFESSNAYNFLICEQKHQVWVSIFLVRKWGIFCKQNKSDLLKFFEFAFSAPPASVSGAMHVT